MIFFFSQIAYTSKLPTYITSFMKNCVNSHFLKMAWSPSYITSTSTKISKYTYYQKSKNSPPQGLSTNFIIYICPSNKRLFGASVDLFRLRFGQVMSMDLRGGIIVFVGKMRLLEARRAVDFTKSCILK